MTYFLGEQMSEGQIYRGTVVQVDNCLGGQRNDNILTYIAYSTSIWYVLVSVVADLDFTIPVSFSGQPVSMCLKLRYVLYMYLMCLIWGTSDAQKVVPSILTNSCKDPKLENFHFLGFSGVQGQFFLHYFDVIIKFEFYNS